MTDNANTFLIYQINGIGWLDMIKKKKLPEKIILNYIAEDSVIFFCTKVITIGQKYGDRANFLDIRFI